MDSLTYHYQDKTNQLNYITDNVAAGNYSTDIDNQSPGNYAYDSTGNLIRVAADGVSNMQWTVYGKLKKAIGTGYGQQYVYDANNNRVIKIGQLGPITGKQYFIRDAQGNVLATYTYDGSTLKWAEQDLYGSSRIGLWGWNKAIPDRAMLPENETDTLSDWYLLGGRYYELTNHLGNVLSVITDKKVGIDDNNDEITDYFSAEVLSQQDYYPFGMLQPGRNIRKIPYPYAFNGKRMENVELFTTNIYDYGMRNYDARIGRFYSVDPLAAKYPHLSPYNFVANNPINSIDPNGAWIFHLFGSTSEQRQAARAVSEATSGEIGDFFTKKIHVDYSTANKEINRFTGEIRNVFTAHTVSFRTNGHIDYHDPMINWVSDRDLEWSKNHYIDKNGNVHFIPASGGIRSVPVLSLMVPLPPVLKILRLGKAAEVAEEGLQVEQYSLRAAENGFYPVMKRGFAHPQELSWSNKGDVWKFGTTKNPLTRYSQSYLDNIGEYGVYYSKEFSGTLKEALRLENMKILNFRFQNNFLPIGNKIIK